MRLGACLCPCALFLGGCAFPSAPALAPGAPSPAPGSLGEAALLGAGAAAGAAVGDALDGGTGALAGGAVGLAGAALIGRAGAGDATREAVERARREERIKVMQRYWDDRTLSRGPDSGAAPAPELLEYPAGSYSGINFAARLAADPSLAEPDR
jgi:hypothetical protein